MKTLEKLQKYIEEINEKDSLKKDKKNINSFIQTRDRQELIDEAKNIDKKIQEGKAGKLAGYIIGVKSNICVKGLSASCGSKTLENFKAPYDASVIKKIKEEDGLIIGMCNMDEFACGSSGETSAFGPTNNPNAKGFVTGGSSSGSSAAVAAGFCDITLGSDTGGSIRNPASHCGIIGLKPSYGGVSRYGLLDLSMSLDQIGPLANSVKDVGLMFSVIQGRDKNDSISFDMSGKEIDLDKIDKKPNDLTIGLLDLSELKVDKKIQDLVEKKTEEIVKKNNWKTKKIKINNLDIGLSTYYPLVYVEFFSSTRRYDGRRYGRKIEDSAGPEVLRRLFGGREITKAEYAGRYYDKALKAKKYFEDEIKKAFQKVDCIVSPVTPKLPHKLGSEISVEEMYAYDALTIPYNLYGNCALSMPCGKIDGLPVGIQLACDKFQEELLFRIARCFEEKD